MKLTKKRVNVDLTFVGDGRVTMSRGIFMGGIPIPKTKNNLSFVVHREVKDEDGILSPILGEEGVKGNFQINITGSSKGYQELGKFFLALAELDTSVDKGFHEHIEGIKSEDGRTKLHIICRKNRM